MSVVGIDLGTTNTVVACVRSGKVHVLADEHGARLLPSVVSFHPNGEVLVGAAAKARRVIDPKNTVYSHKRLIGRSWGSPEIAQAKQRFAFELREGPGQGPLVHARSQDYTLPEISAFVLKRARQIGEAALGTPVERAVITVPAHFNELQRASTKVAGRVSGVEVLRILNEPTAAALAYGLGRSGNERVAVYDFGGGTFDCTLLDLNGNVFEVLATAGDSFLGGDDVDTLIADRMAETFLKQHRQDVRSDPQAYERLKTSAEDMKIQLSQAESHTIQINELGFAVGGKAVSFAFTLTRKELDAMITPLVERSFKVTQDALALARLTPTSFDKVILVGGSTRIPLIRKRVEAFFGGPPMDRVNPDEVVAIGAAIQAAALTEGAKKRGIPAAPAVPAAHAKTMPGLAGGSADSSSEIGAPKPAFGSSPPAFGFQTQSVPSGIPETMGGPPPTGATGARPSPGQVGGPRKITNPGVAPATQPMGARAPQRPATQEDDPSIASLPDLQVPPPFEWVPTTDRGAGSAQGRPSERSFGQDPPTLTKTTAGEEEDLAVTQAREHPDPPRPAAGTLPDPPGSFRGFGSGDEPGSFVSTSTPSARLPSGPNEMPGTFGEIKDDLSLVSTSGIGTEQLKTSPSFGHVSDLSLISSSPTTEAADDAITEARKKTPDEAFEDITEANVRPPDQKPGEHADLPSPAGLTDLPATPKRPQIRKPSMAGKPPPASAPQPFGRMEKIDPAVARANVPMTPGPAPTASSRPAIAGRPPIAKAPPVTTQPMPERPPLDTTAMLNSPPGAPNPFASGAPGAFASGPPAAFASAPPAAFASAPPAYGSAPPQQHGHAAAPMPPPPAPFALAPQPPAALNPFGSAPPPAIPNPPPATPNPPPVQFQQPYPSAPPHGGDAPFDPSMPFGAPPQNGQQPLGYAAPVLVDVTPRALLVETAGGYTDTIIPRNSKIPCERTRRFATGRDMQTVVRVRVAQGEHPHFAQNTFLGEVELSGLRPAHRGEVVVAVTFEVDADGTLRIRARDVATGHEARATLQLIGVADESSVVVMINRFANQPVVGGPTH